MIYMYCVLQNLFKLCLLYDISVLQLFIFHDNTSSLQSMIQRAALAGCNKIQTMNYNVCKHLNPTFLKSWQLHGNLPLKHNLTTISGVSVVLGNQNAIKPRFKHAFYPVEVTLTAPSGNSQSSDHHDLPKHQGL